MSSIKLNTIIPDSVLNIGSSTPVSLSTSGVLTLANTTASTTSGTGALIISSGGLGVGGAINSGSTVSGTTLTSTISTGTAPLTVTSTTRVSNLNVATSGLADTVTTNANLTGPITSTGNATAIASQTGTGSTFVMNTGPTVSALTATGLTTLGTSTQTTVSSTGVLTVANTTVSTSTITGSVVVSGGMGISGTLYATAANITTLTAPHSGLSGLTNDDHTQYALLVGRPGGQTITGGTAASNILTLRSTSNSTKGQVFVDETTPSSSTDTGALIVAGGIGIKSLCAGNAVNGSWNSYDNSTEYSNDIAWGGYPTKLFVSVGNFLSPGPEINYVKTSYDGQTWTARTTTQNSTLNCICWSEDLNLFIAAGNGDIILRSSDGINWSSITHTGVIGAGCCVWTGSPLNKFVIIGFRISLAKTIVLTSSNGISWNETVLSIVKTYEGIDWSPELGILVAPSQGQAGIIYSYDAITWTDVSTSFSGTSVAWSPELSLFVTVSYIDIESSNTQCAMYSSDGINWTKVNTPNSTWNDVCWSPQLGIFIAHGEYNIMCSYNGISWFLLNDILNDIITNNVWSPELSIFCGTGLTYYFTGSITIIDPGFKIDDSGILNVANNKSVGNSLVFTGTGGSINTAGSITLYNATSNIIGFRQAGVAAPSITTRSAGTKLLLYPNLSGSSVDYAIGIESNTMWFSVPNSSTNFRWYAGTTAIASLSGAGVLNIAGNTASTANTTGSLLLAGGIGISNTTDATSSTNGGTITTAGGVAIAKRLYVGTGVNLATASGITSIGSSTPSTVSATGVLTIANTTASTTSGTGALIISSGGLGVGGAINSGSTVTGTILTSTIATGTAPLTVSSTTRVSNLNVATAGLADTVTTNANLTGPITSIGNATSIASQTGTGTTFVVNTGPTVSALTATGLTTLGTSTQATISATGVLTIANTTASTSTTTGSVIVAGGIGIAGSIYVGPNNKNITPNIDDITADVSFSGANNQVAVANITGLSFSTSNTRSFKVQMSVVVIATSSLYSQYTIEGVYNGTTWYFVSNYIGDNPLISLSITNAGQIQYTSSNYAGFVSITMKFRAQTITI